MLKFFFKGMQTYYAACVAQNKKNKNPQHPPPPKAPLQDQNDRIDKRTRQCKILYFIQKSQISNGKALCVILVYFFLALPLKIVGCYDISPRYITLICHSQHDVSTS